MAFPTGSYSNGGMIRICPIGLAFRNTKDEDLYEAARLAILSSHVNPEAIEGSFLIAKAISMGLKWDRKEFNELEFLKTMLSLSKTAKMKERLKKEWEGDKNDLVLLKSPFDQFQIMAVDATALVFWCLCKYWKNPQECMIKCIGFGGDTDTTCCILGGILGAMFGTSWIPHRWFDDLENEEFGRDYCIQLGRWLSELDLKDKDSRMNGIELKKKANKIYKEDPKKAFEIYDEIINSKYSTKLKMDAHSNKALCYILLKEPGESY